MLEKTALSLLFFFVVLMGDASRLSKLKRKEALPYAAFLIAALYLMVIFIGELPWPNLTDLLQAVYGWPTEQLIRLLTVP
ncbi:hypothetical protein [Cohnella hongkongensis]|uniref:Uncharacterized protein n=1 Tax=Cohnella hongkongensis TaxID=178337 RepID=A0ABV9F9U1_9BACL